MRPAFPQLLLALCVASLGTLSAGAEDPWADAVIDYAPVDALPGYTDASKALGAPAGGGTSTPNNNSIVTLGEQGGSITLKFNTPVQDDPLNPMGLDCIVYSNAFWVAGGPQTRWQEPALIEICQGP